MSRPRYMNREELLNLAALDAFSLLDEYEAELFDRSFHHASATVQDEVVALQADLVTDPGFFTKDDPDAELRTRVLESVARAIEQETSRLAPLATIGRRARHDQNAEFPVKNRLFAPIQFWRAACFVLAAALIISMYLYSQAVQEGSRIAQTALNRVTEDQLRTLVGPTFDDFVSAAIAGRNVRAVAFRPENQAFSGNATVYLNEQTNTAFLLGLALPQDRQYTIRATPNAGNAVTLATINGSDPVSGTRLAELSTDLLRNATWEIIDRATGAVILTAIV